APGVNRNAAAWRGDAELQTDYPLPPPVQRRARRFYQNFFSCCTLSVLPATCALSPADLLLPLYFHRAGYAALPHISRFPSRHRHRFLLSPRHSVNNTPRRILFRAVPPIAAAWTPAPRASPADYRDTRSFDGCGCGKYL